jgi:hypothetical protein
MSATGAVIFNNDAGGIAWAIGIRPFSLGQRVRIGAFLSQNLRTVLNVLHEPYALLHFRVL